MNMSQFIGSLPSILPRESVLDRAQDISETLTSKVIPLYLATLNVLGDRSQTCAYNKELEKRWSYNVAQTNLIAGVHEALQKANETLNVIMSDTKQLFEIKEVASSLTRAKALVLQLVHAADFVTQYGMRLLDCLLAMEAVDKADAKAGALSPASLAYIDEKFADFCTCARALMITPDRLRKALKSSAMTTTLARDKELQDLYAMGFDDDDIDPSLKRNLSVRWNPLFHITDVITRWRMKRLENLQNRVKLLHARIAYLQSYQGTSQASAKLESELERLTDAVETDQLKLERMEQDLAEEVPAI